MSTPTPERPAADERLRDSAFLRAARGEPVPHTPVWYMRQAGRSLPEYLRVRQGVGMLESCMDPDLVVEITMQPVRRYGVDAAIFFSDIVLPLKRQAFKRAITNLVSNAVRYGDQIVIRAATEGSWLRVEVDDNGPGIPASERANVFKPFYRIDRSRNQDDGNSGLGLAIARDIAKSHGGDITLGESSMGGLRAIISVPL